MIEQHCPPPSFMQGAPEHRFAGAWITAGEFLSLPRQQVFHRQLDRAARARIENRVRNRHILFRRDFELSAITGSATLFFSADDHAKMYVNGHFVGQGPSPGYPSHYFYHAVDITAYLRSGRNVLAVHSYYQGLINRVWVSGDNRHGFLCDIVLDGQLLLASDESFRCQAHSGYGELGTTGYDTQFLERYDAGAAEADFEQLDFDDRHWGQARLVPDADYQLFPYPLAPLIYEEISPQHIERRADGRYFVDFGAMYVGTMVLRASGRRGDALELRHGQELDDEGNVRHRLRANCHYSEFMILSGRPGDRLRQYDYKAFRYAEILPPTDSDARVDVGSVRLIARHQPFELQARCRFDDEPSQRIWELCVRSLQYGAQEQIQDCMEREKGYYLGDGCYTMLCWCLLSGDFRPMRKFIDDFLRTEFINGGLMTCANCSFMQEIAEYPLMMFLLLPVLLDRGDHEDFVRERLPAFRRILDFYQQHYAQANGLLANLDKWCVVEWPQPMRDGYDVDITEGKVCTVMHNAINAWYVGAVKCYNQTARQLGAAAYPGESELVAAFVKAFYDPAAKLFRDSVESSHHSMPGNIYAWFFGLCPEEACYEAVLAMIREKRLSRCMLFVTFPLFAGLLRDGEEALMHDLLTDEGAWLRMLREGATCTFEGWGKDSKWNTSLFHLTLSYAVAFMCDWPVGKVFDFRP
jgi:alpha-L-rhamnosidase